MKAKGLRVALCRTMAACFLVVLSARAARATNAHFLHGVGASDSAMGGSTIAAPQDTLGALYNNVGSLTQIPGTRVDLNLDVIRSRRHVRSTLGPDTGQTQSDTDFGLIPAFGVAYTPEQSDWTYFIGAIGISGFGADYPQDDSNPVLRPQIENGQNTGGFGHVYSFYQLLRITGGIAAKLTPDLSVGLAPTINYATLSLEPFPGTTPDCTPQGVCAYPNAGDSAPAIGGGFLLGLHYRLTPDVTLGLGYTSPQWFTKFRWNSSIQNPELATFGKGRTFRFQLDAPQSVQFGAGWKATSDLLLTASAKWMNLGGTRGLDESGFDSMGRVKGLGWEDIWAFGVGGQYHVTPKLALRIGYNYSENPVPDRLSFFNTASPVVIHHNVTGGFGLWLGDRVETSLAYYHAFANTIRGPFVAPGIGDVPGSSVENTLAEDSLLLAFSFKL